MCFRNLELLSVNWIFVLQVDSVLEGCGQAQVCFVNTDHLFVFVQHVDVPVTELSWYIEI